MAGAQSEPGVQRSLGSPVPVMYLAGMGRSGTTLVERVLGEIPGVSSLGEVVYLWQRGIVANELCGCGVPFHECPFWSAIGQAAFGGWHNVDTGRVAQLRRQLDDVDMLIKLVSSRRQQFVAELSEYLSYYVAVYRAAQQQGGHRLVVDSSKLTSLAYCLRRSPELRLRVLHMVRDSRGVAYSWSKKVSRPEAVTGGDRPFMATMKPGRTALLWAGHNTLVEALRLLSTPTRLLRYESFVAHPREALNDVLEFAGIAPTAEMLAPVGADWVELGATHQVAGNPMRFSSGRIPIRHDQNWRSGLSPGQRRAVTGITAPVALSLGYRPFVWGASK